MIPRYTRAEMGRVWSDENKFQKWLEVELAAADALGHVRLDDTQLESLTGVLAALG